jgi:hypothetical protein
MEYIHEFHSNVIDAEICWDMSVPTEVQEIPELQKLKLFSLSIIKSSMLD